MITEKCNCDIGPCWRIFRKSVIIFMVVISFDCISAFNLDLNSFVVYQGSKNSHFGFTVVEYIDNSSQSSILIGAPKDKDNVHGPHYKGGAVHVCDVNRASSCNKIKFPEESSKAPLENRTEQWLGGTLTVSGSKGIVMACAPRYYWLQSKNSNLSEPVGNCYYSEKGSLNFTKDRIYHPCRLLGPENAGYLKLGFCQAGFSATISKDSKRLYAGAVGSYEWKGKVFARNTSPPPVSNETAKGYTKQNETYLGYSMTSLNFRGKDATGVAVGIPRTFNSRLNSSGQVEIFNSNLTSLKNLTGQQYATYFGYSMCTSDVDGDGAEDLIIGAPLYSNFESNDYEIGRIYIYYQGNVSCSKLDSNCGKKIFAKNDIIDGKKRAARFGLAVTSLGDINQDGFGDIAVSAPYEGIDVNNKCVNPHKQSGAIYIYLGSKNGLNKNPSQVIRASNLSQTRNTSSSNAFGFSLSGGMDLDKNLYPDLVVGAYESDTAYLFKSRPIIHLNVNFSFLVEKTKKGKIIPLGKTNCKKKNDGKNTLCVGLEVCLRYHGVGVEKQIEISTNITLDLKKPKTPRMRFETDNGHILEKTFSISENKSCCEKMIVYVNNSDSLLDKVTPLEAQLQYDLVESKNNKTIPSMLDLESRIRTDRLILGRNCGNDDICVPDLNLTIVPNPDKYVIPSSTKFLNLRVLVKNNGEDSYDSKFTLKLPKGLDYYNYIENESKEDARVSIDSLSSNYENITYRIGNPLRENQMVNFTIYLEPSLRPELYNSRFDFWASVNSTDREDKNNMKDNQISFQVPIIIDTEISIENASSHLNPYNISKYDLENATSDMQAGPKVIHQYIIRNSGTLMITEMSAVFYWPSKLNTGDDLLYLVKQPMTEGAIRCTPIPNINHRNLTVNHKYDKVFNSSDDNAYTSNFNPSLKYSTVLKTTNETSLNKSECHWPQTWWHHTGTDRSAEKPSSLRICFQKIHCTIHNLTKHQEVSVVFPSILWGEKIYKIAELRNINHLEIASYVEVKVSKLPNNRAPETNKTYYHEAVTRFDLLRANEPNVIPLWIVVGSSCLGVLILMLMIYAMYKFGFFNRTRPPTMSGLQAQSIDDFDSMDEDLHHI